MKTVTHHLPPARRRGFTLIEVMIAIAILFIGTFAILGLISSSLNTARLLKRPLIDASAVISQLTMTNQLVEGTYNGNLSDLLGKTYQDYAYVETITEEQSNKLFNVDVVIFNARGNKAPISRNTTLLYRPQSPAGSLDGGNFVH
jgi:prepilin-type N-terminal cleavage/methylation domain-containing protein